MQPVCSTTTRCLVCGFTEIRIDEALDRELVVLGECPRCEHRWIGSSDGGRLGGGALRSERLAPKIASAA